jgi:outer membrane protein insertion porin family
VKKLLLSTALICAYANAGVVIQGVDYTGLTRMSPLVAGEITGVQKGKNVDIDIIDQSIKTLFNQGYFEDIWVDNDNGYLTYHFKELPVIAQITFSGYSDTDQEDAMKKLGVKVGDTYKIDKVLDSTKVVIAGLEEDGYVNSVVETETKPIGKEGSIELIYTVSKGEKIYIEELNMVGRKELSETKALSQAANKKRDFMGWMWGLNDGKLRLTELQYDPARIKDVYMQYGYLDATVSPPFLRADFDTYIAALDYKVSEGSAYKVDSITIDLRTAVIPEEQIREAIKLKPGSTFNINTMRKDLEKIKFLVADAGYAFTQVVPDFAKNDENKTVGIIYRIDPGQKVYIKDVIISGNNRTADNVVRRNIFLAPGDQYNLTDLTDSKSAISRTGFFENSEISEERVSEDKMNLIVKLKEQPTGQVMLGGGYGSYDKLMLNAGISDKNIVGTGMDLSFNLTLSAKQQNYVMSLMNPRFRDSEYSLGGSLYASQNVWYNYTTDVKGASATSGRQISRYFGAGATYSLASIKYSDIQNITTLPTNMYNTTNSSITPFANYDDTDDYQYPRKGVRASASLQYAGIGGSERFAKAFGKAAYFKGLQDEIDYDAILSARGKIGSIFYKPNVTLNDMFFIGGDGTVRGWQYNSISSKDQYGNLIGNYDMDSVNLGINMPLIAALKVRYTIFLDYASNGNTIVSTTNQRYSTGVALEWGSPMGPLQLIFSKPLNPQSGDRLSIFEFNFGSRF